MTKTKNLTARITWADLTRVIAILGVITIHTSAPVFYAKAKISENWFFTGTMIDAFCRVAVPLFVMLSGALLLKGDDGPFKLNRMVKQVSRVFIPLVFWSIICGFWIDYYSDRALNPFPHILRMLSEPVMYHLQFCYYILGVYLLLPLLDVIAWKIQKSTSFAYYFFAVWIFTNCLTVYVSVPLFNLFQISELLAWSGYFLLGFFLTKKEVVEHISASLAFAVYTIGSLVSFYVTLRLSDAAGAPVETGFKYLAPNVVISSAALFIFMQKINIPKLLQRPLFILSELSFMIYFMHILVIEIIKSYHVSSFAFHPSFGILGSTFVAFVFSVLLAKLLRLIPGSAKVLG